VAQALLPVFPFFSVNSVLFLSGLCVKSLFFYAFVFTAVSRFFCYVVSQKGRIGKEAETMALDWAQCPAVESVPGKLSGAWVFRGTRMPVATVFENLEDGLTIDEIIEQFDVTREQVTAVLEFAARSLEAPVNR